MSPALTLPALARYVGRRLLIAGACLGVALLLLGLGIVIGVAAATRPLSTSERTALARLGACASAETCSVWAMHLRSLRR